MGDVGTGACGPCDLLPSSCRKRPVPHAPARSPHLTSTPVDPRRADGATRDTHDPRRGRCEASGPRAGPTAVRSLWTSRSSSAYAIRSAWRSPGMPPGPFTEDIEWIGLSFILTSALARSPATRLPAPTGHKSSAPGTRYVFVLTREPERTTARAGRGSRRDPRVEPLRIAAVRRKTPHSSTTRVRRLGVASSPTAPSPQRTCETTRRRRLTWHGFGWRPGA